MQWASIERATTLSGSVNTYTMTKALHEKNPQLQSHKCEVAYII